VRKLLFNVHLYVALVSGIFVLILGLTGAIMAFEPEIDHVLHWKLSYVTPQGIPKPLTELGEAVGKAYPSEQPGGYLVPGAPNLSYGVATKRGLVAVNPYTAEILGVDQYTGQVLFAEGSRTAPAGARLVIANRAIHTGDIFGIPSKTAMCLACLLAVVQLASGLMMWLKRVRR